MTIPLFPQHTLPLFDAPHSPPPGLRDHLTHRANLKATRYGWLRLTPAYSVHLVTELLAAHGPEDGPVLDPFCGTGTTALVCAERGIPADTTDINAFLIWLATAKTASYVDSVCMEFLSASDTIAEAIEDDTGEPTWTPPLFQIEKWWDAPTLRALGRALCAIKGLELFLPAPAADLLRVAFCRTMIERSSVSFGHQSMSFKKGGGEAQETTDGERESVRRVSRIWRRACGEIARAAQSPIERPARVLLCDARCLTDVLPREHYGAVVTSPPYPNRMSYVRELRPYMYWLGFLRDGREAGELDWQAIGGTWGCATSLVGKWTAPDNRAIPYAGFGTLLREIGERSPVLSRYVHKYFYDMAGHAAELFCVVRHGGTVHYIVGNSKFYDVLLPVQDIFAGLFEQAGFSNVEIKTIRKRTSKKELYEYVVSARKP